MECVFTKKYEKVDSFLKRFLSHSRYTGVRLIEPCVALSDVYNKQFKFVVLADEWLYVTENPPKVAKDIQEVTRILDITSVELINDVPDFLGGDLKYRTHHILVTYKKGSEFVSQQLTPNSSPNLLTKSLQENDLRNSREDSRSVDEIRYDGQEDKLSKSLQEYDVKSSRRKSPSISRLEENSSLRPSTSRKPKDNLSRSLQENDLKHSRRKLSSDHLEEKYAHRQDKPKHSLSPILPPGRTRIRKQSRNSLDDDYSYENDSSLDPFEANQEQQNRLLPTAKRSQEKTRRKSSPGTFYEDESLDQNSDFLMRSNDGRLTKAGENNLSPTTRTLKEKSRRKSNPVTFIAKTEAFDQNSSFTRRSSDGRLSKSTENSLSPKPVARTLPGRKCGSNTLSPNEGGSFDHDANSKTRASPLIKFSSVDSEDGDYESNSIPLHYSFSTTDHFRSKNSPTRLTVSASAADLRAMQIKFDPTLNSGSQPNLTSTPKSGLMGSFNGLQSWFKERRSSKPGDKNAGVDKSAGQSGDLDGSFKEEASSKIHLYMILDDTVMLSYLRSIWDNCLLNSAVKYAKKEKSPKTVVKNKPNSSQVTALFDQMEKEILNSEDFQVTFELVHELLTACQKDVLVKKLFWQSPDLFVFLVKKVNDYVKESPGDPMKANRADELEFVLLLIECLTEMFRETELLSSRMTRLQSKKYSVVRDLILASISCPELSKTSSVIETPDISEAAEILLTGRHRKKKNKKEKSSHDIELENLSSELVRHQVALLHEMFIIAYQAVWFPSDDKTLKISWMVKIVESSTTVHRYLQAFVEQVMEIITRAENNFLTSDDTTLLYRLLSVLKTILQQSSKLRRHIHDFYTEEFRYYVKPQTISSSLSPDCPLTPSTLKLVDDVIGLVTDTPLKNRRPPR